MGPNRRWDRSAVPDDVLAAMENGVRAGLADLDAAAAKRHSSIGLFGSREQLGTDCMTRAVAANMGIYGQVPEEARYDWLPSPAKGPFTVIYRLYGAPEAAVRGEWRMPPISRTT